MRAARWANLERESLAVERPLVVCLCVEGARVLLLALESVYCLMAVLLLLLLPPLNTRALPLSSPLLPFSRDDANY